MSEPLTRFAPVGADRVAWQTLGEGPRDLVYVAGLWSHLDMAWESPAVARFLRRLGGLGRLIRFDRRDSGISDPRPPDGSPIEHWQQDLLAVLDAARSRAPVIVAGADAGPLALAFAAAFPERCSALVLYATAACVQRRPDYPQGHSAGFVARLQQTLPESWGQEASASLLLPSQARHPDVLRWYAKFERAMASPRQVVENLAWVVDLDVRALLDRVQVPALVIARRDLRLFLPEQARHLAEHLPQGRYEEVAGADLLPYWDGSDEILALVERFLTGRRAGGTPDRQLATVLFTDLVDSTKLAVKLGDAAWRALLDRHDQTVREQIAHHGGRLVDSAGDGTLAVFPTPGEAIDCGHALHKALRPLKLRMRAGVHIGELELREDGRVGGIAVHIGARVLGLAKSGQVLVSRTVRDVLIGSAYRFKDAGMHELRGVPSKWPLYAAELP